MTTLTKEYKNDNYIFSSMIDLLCLGGLSFVFLFICHLFINNQSNTSQISWKMFYAAYLINHPHFLASYILLYWDNRSSLLKKNCILASLITPIILIAYITYCMVQNNVILLSYLANTMYFLVGWHYVKQIYGCIIVYCVRNKYYFNNIEKNFLKTNLYGTWFISYLNGNTAVSKITFHGIEYSTFAIPLFFTTINTIVLYISISFFIFFILKKFIKEGVTPPPAAVITFCSIYIWHAPLFYHPHFFYMIPLFHSLQYLLIVIGYKYNEYKQKSQQHNLNKQIQRKIFLRNFFGFILISITTGYIFFDAIPNFLDKNITYNQKIFGSHLYLFVFMIFINVHHYFIDHVIWRRNNPKLKSYLFDSVI